MEEKFGIYITKIGNIAIGYIGKYITSIKIISDEDKNKINEYVDNRNKITDDAYMQIQEYLEGKRKSFRVIAIGNPQRTAKAVEAFLETMYEPP